MKRLAIVGAGMMGEALARGLIAAGWSREDLVFADIKKERLDELAGQLGVDVTTDPPDACRAARGVLLAVKPQDATVALESFRGCVGEHGLLSIVAGTRTSAIEAVLGEASVVRAMPNTPARVGKGVTALAVGSVTSEQTKDLASAVFSSVGPVVWLDEELLDAVTAVSGSGPAYVFYLAESMIEAGVRLGLARDVAATLAFATIEGAGVMLTTLDTEPEVLRAQVTSPGGTTAAAVSVLDGRDVKAIFNEALQAARDRGRELGS